jgi:hypothetical protein
MTDGPIETYLDQLLTQSALPPRQTRRLLAEAEAHLYDVAADLEGRGLPPAAAQTEAVARFGADPGHLVRGMQQARRPAPRDVIGMLAHVLLIVGGAGLVAIGVSGALAWFINAVAGPQFVGGLPGTYGVGACQRFLSLHAGAGSCQAAAQLENSQDAVVLRLLAGGLGLVTVLIALVWRRRRLSASQSRTVDTISAGLAAVAFGAAAIFLSGMSADVAAQHGSEGVGWYLTGALVAGAAFVLCVWRLLWALRPVLRAPGAVVALGRR